MVRSPTGERSDLYSLAATVYTLPAYMVQEQAVVPGAATAMGHPDPRVSIRRLAVPARAVPRLANFFNAVFAAEPSEHGPTEPGAPEGPGARRRTTTSTVNPGEPNYFAAFHGGP
jgi:hypothetical protein